MDADDHDDDDGDDDDEGRSHSRENSSGGVCVKEHITGSFPKAGRYPTVLDIKNCAIVQCIVHDL